MKSNNGLVKYLLRSKTIWSEAIINAFSRIDRKDFVLRQLHAFAYADIPLSMGDNQTISQPSTVGFMLELLEARKGDNVLDIGAGSGWTTTLLADLVGVEGSVVGVERILKLVSFGQENLKKYCEANAKIVISANAIGIPGNKFDRILVSASASVFPDELLKQLNTGGIIVIPIRKSIFRYIKHGINDLQIEEYPGFKFVPLILESATR